MRIRNARPTLTNRIRAVLTFLVILFALVLLFRACKVVASFELEPRVWGNDPQLRFKK